MRNNSNLNGTNLKLNKETGKVYSYGWYEIADLNENVLNTFPYSSSTIKHIHHVRRYVRTQLKEVYAPMGLNNPKNSIHHLELMLIDVRNVMNSLKRKDTKKYQSLMDKESIYLKSIEYLKSDV